MSASTGEISHTLALLTQAPHRLEQAIRDVETARLHLRSAAEPWSVSDILAHLRACADVWGKSIAAMPRVSLTTSSHILHKSKLCCGNAPARDCRTRG